MDQPNVEQQRENALKDETISALIDEVTEIIEGGSEGNSCCVYCNQCHFCR